MIHTAFFCKMSPKRGKTDANTAVKSDIAKHDARIKVWCFFYAKSKQASYPSNSSNPNPAKAHGNAPADLPGPPPPPDPGEMAALARF